MKRYQNHDLEVADKEIRTLVERNDIKGLAYLAARMQAAIIEKQDMIAKIEEALFESLSKDDVMVILTQALNRHMFCNQYMAKLVGKGKDVPEQDKKKWAEVSDFVNAWSGGDKL
nr:MAG TPA: hypothetical protein [Caudoviricetes sp.]